MRSQDIGSGGGDFCGSASYGCFVHTAGGRLTSIMLSLCLAFRVDNSGLIKEINLPCLIMEGRGNRAKGKPPCEVRGLRGASGAPICTTQSL